MVRGEMPRRAPRQDTLKHRAVRSSRDSYLDAFNRTKKGSWLTGTRTVISSVSKSSTVELTSCADAAVQDRRSLDCS